MKAVLILDLDGLVILKDRPFSLRLSEKFGIPQDEILPFFKNEFQTCLVGKSDLKKELQKYLTKWGWKGTIDEVLKFWFQGQEKVDERVIRLVDSLRKNGAKVYVATNNEKYRARYLSDIINSKDHFDGFFSSAELGFKKPNEKFFISLLKKIRERPENVMFWDDDEENVEGARSIGISANFYSDFESFSEEIKNNGNLY